MTPSFKLATSERLYIDGTYCANGHWLMHRQNAQAVARVLHRKEILKVLNQCDSLKHGTYADGVANGASTNTPPDMAAIIPQRTGYGRMTDKPCGVSFRNESDEIIAYKFGCNASADDGFTVGVAHRYVPLLRLGHGFAKDKNSPIIVLDSDDLNGNLLAVIMPVRL